MKHFGLVYALGKYLLTLRMIHIVLSELLISVLIYKVEYLCVCLWVSEWVNLFVTDKLSTFTVYPTYDTYQWIGMILGVHRYIIRLH